MTSWSTLFHSLIEAGRIGPAEPHKDNTGVQTSHWFWGAADRISNSADKNQTPDIQDNTDAEPKKTADEQVNDLILQTPQISGAALLNAMKSKGLKIVSVVEAKKSLSWHKQAADKMRGIKKKEADSGSSFAGVQVKSKETKFRITSNNLKESSSDDGVGPTRFKVVLIEEGLGNMNDAFYYSREALESAVTVFTGSKIYADHPSSIDEESRPERSVRDVLGHFENLRIEESEDRAQLIGDLVMLADKPFEWARALMIRAVENSKKFPEKNFIGLSINASGDAQETKIEDVLSSAPEGAKPKLVEAQQQGIDSVKVVRMIKSAVSCDLVTEAGAGGKIINYIERNQSNG